MAGKIVVDTTILDRIRNRLGDVESSFADSSVKEAEGWASDIGPSSINGAASDYIGESEAMYDRMSQFIKDLGEGIDQVSDSFVQTDDELAASLEKEEG